MRRALLVISAALASGMAHAEVNKCMIDGHATWQSAPCPPGTAVNEIVAPEPEPGPPPRHPPSSPARQEESSKPSGHEICSDVSTAAERVMRARQRGGVMRDMMDRASDSELLQAMIMDAFDDPRFSTERVQNSTILDFSNRYYLQCMQEAKDRGW